MSSHPLAAIRVSYAFALMLALSLSILAGCKDSAGPRSAASTAQAKPSSEMQRSLNAAVGQGNLEAIRELLKGGAEPDRAIGVDRDALATAGELCKQNQKKETIWPPLRAFMLLRHHVRHRDAKMTDVQATLEMSLVSGGQQGVSYAQLSARLPDGSQYPVAISSEETKYVGAALNGRQFVVAFSRTYRLVGTLQKGTLEVDELHLLEARASSSPASATDSRQSGGAMAIPVPLFLPSTNEALEPYLG